MSNLKIFDGKNIRAKWNDDEDQWWFVVQDVIQYLTDSVKPRDYWYRLKQRVHESDGIELSTFCRQLKFEAGNGKKYKYECANNESLFRIIQSSPSPKAHSLNLEKGQEHLRSINIVTC